MAGIQLVTRYGFWLSEFLMRFRIINSPDETFNSFIIHFQALKIYPYCSVIQLQWENKADIRESSHSVSGTKGSTLIPP
jgi:hypothetical protein